MKSPRKNENIIANSIEFKKHFRSRKKINEILPNRIYAFSYMPDSNIPTDKHNFTPLVLSFGISDNECFEGMNLFFIDKNSTIDIINRIKNPKNSLYETKEIYYKKIPHVFKEYDIHRILRFSEINESEWDVIPFLKKSMFGVFNERALIDDFSKEIFMKSKKMERKRKKSIEKNIEKEEEIEKYEVIDEEFLDNMNISEEYRFF